MDFANGMVLLPFVLLVIHVLMDVSKQQKVIKVMGLHVGFHKNIIVAVQNKRSMH
jgi:hypothetical protein